MVTGNRDEAVSDHTPIDAQPVSDHAQREANRRRAAKAREKRQQAGQTRISAWIPQERASYARQVLQAVIAGGNALPPDPEQSELLKALRAELAQAQAAAVQREGELTAERDAADARARTAEHERDALQGRLQAAEHARADAERFQALPGLRGRAIRWLASRPGMRNPVDRR